MQHVMFAASSRSSCLLRHPDSAAGCYISGGIGQDAALPVASRCMQPRPEQPCRDTQSPRSGPERLRAYMMPCRCL